MSTVLKALLLALGVIAVASCANIKSAPRGVLVAKQACELNALAEEHNAIVSRISAMNNIFPREYDETENDHRYTILDSKLRDYSAEVEASYRFVTQNCNTYNLCMEENRFNEQMCASSRKSWDESHTRFNILAIRIKELEVGYHPHHPPHGDGHPGHGGRAPCASGKCLPPTDCRAVNCDVQGSVFSTGCCYDGD